MAARIRSCANVAAARIRSCANVAASATLFPVCFACVPTRCKLVRNISVCAPTCAVAPACLRNSAIWSCSDFVLPRVASACIIILVASKVPATAPANIQGFKAANAANFNHSAFVATPIAGTSPPIIAPATLKTAIVVCGPNSSTIAARSPRSVATFSNASMVIRTCSKAIIACCACSLIFRASFIVTPIEIAARLTLSRIVDHMPIRVFDCASIAPSNLPPIPARRAFTPVIPSIAPCSASFIASGMLTPISFASISHTGMPSSANCIISSAETLPLARIWPSARTTR
ncbi:MAG: hypothetical protein DDT37_01771 [Firmicutes bacterium]|nr:hypothetical protein [candidate division NPL-UPA2 bacterium]